MTGPVAIDYTDVTEACGNQITSEALDMMWTRYAFAAQLSAGLDVLEVACGAGQGLGELARHARQVVGGDYTSRLVVMARQQYGAKIPLLQLDAQALPFRDRAFDVVVLFEALYYLPDAGRFVSEGRRVLRSGGRIVICTVNAEWADFNPSPQSTKYYAADQLRALLKTGFDVELYGAFPVSRASVRDHVVSAVKRSAVALGLMPKTMRGKRLLKRVFLGRLADFPADIGSVAAHYRPPVVLPPGAAAADYKVLYAIGRARA